jgi:hypothetical protein
MAKVYFDNGDVSATVTHDIVAICQDDDAIEITEVEMRAMCQSYLFPVERKGLIGIIRKAVIRWL